MTYYLTKDELVHHGIIGQKWGIRRYQNSDGTYTEAGKKRRIKDYSKAYRRKKNRYDIVEDIRKNVLTANQQRKLNKLAYKLTEEENKYLEDKYRVKYEDLKSFSQKKYKNDVWWKNATSTDLGKIYRSNLKKEEYRTKMEDEIYQIIRKMVSGDKLLSQINDKEYDTIINLTEELSRHFQTNFDNSSGYSDAMRKYYAENTYKNAKKTYDNALRIYNDGEVDTYPSELKDEVDSYKSISQELNKQLREKYK